MPSVWDLLRVANPARDLRVEGLADARTRTRCLQGPYAVLGPLSADDGCDPPSGLPRDSGRRGYGSRGNPRVLSGLQAPSTLILSGCG